MNETPSARGSLVAVAAAIMFGVMAPLLKHFGAGVGAFATAALLYAGAALGSGVRRRRPEEPPLRRAQLQRIALVAVFGAALAPACLAWGLQHTGALAASLLLNLEAVFTVLFARLFYREPISRRVALAVGLMVTAGALLAARSGLGGASSALGIAAIAVATLCWALDNTLTRPLSEFDPRAVVFGKASSGAVLSTLAALVLREAWPAPKAALALLACGAVGFGLSLRLYLRAQRMIGSARTGSLFAVAPFVGAVLALVLGDRQNALLVTVSGALFGLAVYLHATEAYVHRPEGEARE